MGNRKERVILVLLKVLFAFICIWGVATSISMNLVNRSLWLDEAMLSYSFGKRTLLNLWSGAFEADQIAPLGWLYIVKLITVLFGNTEFTLRIASVFFYALTMIALYYYMHVSLGRSQVTALSCAALYANLPFVLCYSNVFKPYIADGFFVLLILISFAAWRRGKLKTWSLTLIWCMLIWFSNPVVFIQAGCLLVELFCALKGKKWAQFKQLFLVGVCILSCFVFYYLFWLRSVAVSDYMQGYWKNDYFPFIPTSRQDLKHFIDCINILFNGFSNCKWAMIVLVTIVIWHSICSRNNKALLYIMISSIVALCVSWVHFYPISDRLWVFLIPLMAAFCLTGLEELDETESVAAVIAFTAIALRVVLRLERWDVVIVLLLCLTWAELKRRDKRFDTVKIGKVARVVIPLALVLFGGGIQTYWNHPENVYWPNEELNDEIIYLKEHVSADEPIYVYCSSKYGWQYKLGYDNTSFEGYDGKVTYGAVPFNDMDNGQNEINTILNHEKIYIVSSHLWRKRFQPLAEKAKTNGYLELVLYEHETPLWFFCKDLADSKIEASWEIAERDGNTFSVHIRNIGPAWLNHIYENVYLTDTVSGAITAFPKIVEPGGEITLTIECADEPQFTLLNDEGPICTARTFHHES